MELIIIWVIFIISPFFIVKAFIISILCSLLFILLLVSMNIYILVQI